ncbi:ATP-dependent RNA helicase DDX55/SPB4 [Geosmithia morbida]|uniref:ATP-dependent RNA helicase n=1 Tax=Geosmithia morbida TaxID=1094350 RepID=A0A9P5D785_9HYPO|nr:ATP-dependent RNA helicase DDX55/SPB4 [Geosmithia morbida]KAF4126376.1 ATP-dependent RNA helicase DDX55/SPB4 [Geosmithia morbida]
MAPGKAGAGVRNARAWNSLKPPLAEWILEAVSTMGFKQMTPVQAASVPHFLGNKDVVVEAVTGSGKTLAYLLPVVQKLLRLEEPTKRHHVGAIIVAPTRELSMQIHSVLTSLLKFHAPSAEILPQLKGEEKREASTAPVIVPQLVVGGSTTTVAQDLSFFLRHSPNVLIGSPGRLVELLSSPHVHCPQSSFEMLVLDEADRLLDLGFKPDLQSILGQIPKQRRTGLFSASVSEAVGEIIRVGLRNPVKIEVKVKMKDGGGVILEDRRTPASLQMCYMVKQASHKLPALANLLERLPQRPQRSIVFLSTCAAVDYFQHVLAGILPAGFSLIPLHGKHPAKVREKNFGQFVSSVSPSVLLTTDLAARGLDIPQVDLVVQVDAPSDPKVFIHRSGRAGRAGRKGLAVVMLHPGPEEDYVRFLDIRKTPIAPLERPKVTTTQEEADEVSEKIRSLVRTDRALHDKAQRAFVSWVRSYVAHQATSIFRAGELDWADLGRAWGLLRLPRMPESKTWEGDRSLGVEVDWDSYAYKDKAREQARREALENPEHQARKEREAESRKRKKSSNDAWSVKHGKEEERVERREKRHKRRDAERQAKMTDEEKLKQAELGDLIKQVRLQNQAKTKAAAADEEFTGFDD